MPAMQPALTLPVTNGSGKATLAEVLAGFYRPGAGHVTWDGLDTATFDTRFWQARVVAVVLQDFVGRAPPVASGSG
jgi:ABC-type transport system involved in cytochrome bd biosynthesis fused ATPase/permease subunit